MITFKDQALEREARAAIALDEARALLERFATLTRESGSEDERAAGRYIVDRLTALGVPVTVHDPELFLSVPERSELRVIEAPGARGLGPIASRPPAFARPTAGEELTGEVCYVPSKYAGGTADLFDTPLAAASATSESPGRTASLAEARLEPRASEGRPRRAGAASGGQGPPDGAMTPSPAAWS